MLSPFLDTLSRDWNIGNSTLFSLRLAVEEILVNTISYGYHDLRRDNISIDFGIENEYLYICIDDMADRYNPLETAPADTESQLNERTVGGLGIHLVKNLCTDIHYDYVNGHNKLTLIIKAV